MEVKKIERIKKVSGRSVIICAALAAVCWVGTRSTFWPNSAAKREYLALSEAHSYLSNVIRDQRRWGLEQFTGISSSIYQTRTRYRGYYPSSAGQVFRWRNQAEFDTATDRDISHLVKSAENFEEALLRDGKTADTRRMFRLVLAEGDLAVEEMEKKKTEIRYSAIAEYWYLGVLAELMMWCIILIGLGAFGWAWADSKKNKKGISWCRRVRVPKWLEDRT